MVITITGIIMSKATMGIIVLVVTVGLLLTGFYVYKKKARAPGNNLSATNNSDTNTAGSTKNESGPTLAKTAYNIAKPYAQKWANDATLTEITNFIGTELTNGKSTRWSIRFFSKEKDKDYVVTIVNGNFFQDEERTHFPLDPITTDWVNSDVAMTTAMSHLSGENCTNLWMGISENRWRIKCSRENAQPKWIDMDLGGNYVSEKEGY